MKQASTFSELYQQIRMRFIPFMLVFFAVIFLTYLVLFVVDLYPEPKETTDTADKVVTVPEPKEITKPVVQAATELPEAIIFDTLDRKVVVLNPESNDLSVLDGALLSGVVRHPQSAELNEEGNILLLGHSSYLPTVFNKNFQAFNGIQDLKWGDVIRVQSADQEYIYQVDKVYQAKASEVVVPTSVTGSRLTLATCNVFGAKEDRYIVEATLISKVALR